MGTHARPSLRPGHEGEGVRRRIRRTIRCRHGSPSRRHAPSGAHPRPPPAEERRFSPVRPGEPRSTRVNYAPSSMPSFDPCFRPCGTIFSEEGRDAPPPSSSRCTPIEIFPLSIAISEGKVSIVEGERESRRRSTRKRALQAASWRGSWTHMRDKPGRIGES